MSFRGPRNAPAVSLLNTFGRFDEMLKASAEASLALKANSVEADSVHCPFYTRFGVSIFEYYKRYPENSGRFAMAMAGWRKSEFSRHFSIPSLLVISTLQGKNVADKQRRSGKQRRRTKRQLSLGRPQRNCCGHWWW